MVLVNHVLLITTCSQKPWVLCACLFICQLLAAEIKPPEGSNVEVSNVYLTFTVLQYSGMEIKGEKSLLASHSQTLTTVHVTEETGI